MNPGVPQKVWSRLWAENMIDTIRRDGIYLIYDARADQIIVAVREGETISSLNSSRIKMIHTYKDAVKKVLVEDVCIGLKWNPALSSLIGLSHSKNNTEFLACVKGCR